jgi:DedD protein
MCWVPLPERQRLQSKAMEVRVRERLIGALVLVVIVVLIVPAVLKGRGPEPAQAPSAQVRRVEVPIGSEKAVPDDQVLVPEPALPGARPAAAPAELKSAPQAGPVIDAVPPPPASKESVTQKPPSPAAAPATAAQLPPKPAAAPSAVPGRQASPQAATAWAVQLGAYSNRAKADEFVAELRKRRYSAFVLEYRASGKVLYRVRVGPEQDRARAEEIAERLAKDGYQPLVARHP